MDGAIKVDLFDLLATGEWGWERGEKFSVESWLARGQRGLVRSRGGANPSGLLNDFLKLGHEDIPEGGLPETVIEQVVTFVKR
jgi:hypothetical protein